MTEIAHSPLQDVCFVLLTYNEQNRLPACLDSLEGLGGQVFAVDSHSSDGTLDLLRKRGIKFTQRAFKNYGDQRRWAQNNLPYDTPWVFHLDADERISEPLREWLLGEFAHARHSCDGFLFSRRTVFMGRWIRWGGQYPSYHLRLFKRQVGHCEDKEYDQHFVLKGKICTVPRKDIIDIVAADLGSFITAHNKWASLEAAEAYTGTISGEVRPALDGTPIERRRWLKNTIYGRSPLFLRSVLYFVFRFVFRLGFLDGKEGVVFHVLQGFWFRFLIDAKIFEMRRKERPA